MYLQWCTKPVSTPSQPLPRFPPPPMLSYNQFFLGNIWWHDIPVEFKALNIGQGKERGFSLVKLLIDPNHPQTIQTPTAGFTGFWWSRYCVAQTGILCTGPGVPIPAKSNSWVVVLLHGVVFDGLSTV